MGEHASRERLQPSLLDRLIDDERDRTRETSDRQTLSNAQLRAAVQRDLAWLLNTSRLETTENLAGLPRTAASTLNYGIPGLAGTDAGSRQLATLQEALAEAIRRYEPRILPETLKVRIRPRDEATATTIRLDIEGVLWAQPAPQQLFLQSTIDLETRAVSVTDQQRR